jgi:hypothetical protein
MSFRIAVAVALVDDDDDDSVLVVTARMIPSDKGTCRSGGGASIKTTPATGRSPRASRVRAASKATTPPKDQPPRINGCCSCPWEEEEEMRSA